MKEKIFKLVKQVFPWIVTIISFVFVLKGIDYKELFDVLSKIDVSVLTFALLNTVIFTLYICVYKFKSILKFLGYDVPFEDVQVIKLGVLPMKTFMPLKIGEFIRAVYLNKKYNVPYRLGVYSIVLGYLLRMIVLGIFVIASVVSCNNYMLWFAIIFLLLCLLAVLFKDLKLLLYSLLFELSLIFNYFIVLKSLSVNVSFLDFFTYIPLVLFLESLPISIYGFGVRESLFVLLLGKNIGIEKAVVCGLTGSFMNSVVPLLTSLFFVLPFAKKFFNSEVKYEPSVVKQI